MQKIYRGGLVGMTWKKENEYYLPIIERERTKKNKKNIHTITLYIYNILYITVVGVKPSIGHLREVGRNFFSLSIPLYRKYSLFIMIFAT